MLWGLNWPAMKVAVGEISPWTFRAVCVVVGAAGLIGVAAARGERILVPRAQIPALLLVALLSVTGWHMFSAYGLTHMEGGRSAIVAYTMPVWAAIFSSIWLGERLQRRTIVALALGMAGVGTLVAPSFLAAGGALTGPLFMLAAAAAWAGGIVALKRVRWEVGMIAHTGWQLVLGGIPIVLVWLWLRPPVDLASLSWPAILGATYAATVAMIFCFAAHNKVVTLLPATVAALSTLAIPIVGLLCSALLLGERITLSEVVAMALVGAAMLLVLVPGQRRAA